jgi:hypothetical protein
MSSARQRARAFKMPQRWFLIKDNQRVLPCKRGKKPCLTRIRVRTVEPGPQSRKCPSCGTVHWFNLVETTQVRDGLTGLRFKWATEDKVRREVDDFLSQTEDIGISR